MDPNTATEIAYKNGYKKGLEEGMDEMLSRLKAKTAYDEGYEVGKQAALIRVHTALHDAVAKCRANDNESRYENLVVMLSDVDRVISQVLEGK